MKRTFIKKFATINLFGVNCAIGGKKAARKLNPANAANFADAHVFSAARAKSVGLVDIIGTKQQAKKEIAKLSNVEEPEWKEKDKMDQFIEKVSNQTSAKISSYLFGLKATL